MSKHLFNGPVHTRGVFLGSLESAEFTRGKYSFEVGTGGPKFKFRTTTTKTKTITTFPTTLMAQHPKQTTRATYRAKNKRTTIRKPSSPILKASKASGKRISKAILLYYFG